MAGPAPRPSGHRVSAPGTFATKTDALRWLAAVETDVGRGDWHDPRAGDVTFADWARQWMAVKEPKLAESTIDLYRYLLRRHVTPTFGAITVGQITAVDVQRWHTDLHASELSPNTLRRPTGCSKARSTARSTPGSSSTPRAP